MDKTAMNYGPQGIQQERRLFEIGEETGSIKGKHRQGQRSERKKGTSWKYRSTCEHCGTEFAGRKGAANRFCKQSCQYEIEVMKWFPCSVCLAAVGFGSKTCGKLLKIDPSRVITQWNKRGVVANRPNGGSLKNEAGRIRKIQATRNKISKITGKRVEQEYNRASILRIKEAEKFPDWGSLWQKETLPQYREMTQEQRRKHNKKVYIRRKKKIKSDPTFADNKRKYAKRWKSMNKERVRRYARNAAAKRKILDPGFKIQCNLRNRLKEFMVSAKKGGTPSARKLLGCSTKQLAAHLESKFTRRMSWENYGTYWHVDHILPCASFDHTDQRQIAQCWHWTNLRPMEAKANMRKSDTITEPQMNLLLCADF